MQMSLSCNWPFHCLEIPFQVEEADNELIKANRLVGDKGSIQGAHALLQDGKVIPKNEHTRRNEMLLHHVSIILEMY